MEAMQANRNSSNVNPRLITNNYRIITLSAVSLRSMRVYERTSNRVHCFDEAPLCCCVFARQSSSNWINHGPRNEMKKEKRRKKKEKRKRKERQKEGIREKGRRRKEGKLICWRNVQRRLIASIGGLLDTFYSHSKEQRVKKFSFSLALFDGINIS